VLGFLRDWISGSPVTYLVLLGAAVLDLVAIVPSETLVITASIVAADDGSLFWGFIGLSAAVGAFAGDNVLYLLGSRFGEPVASRLFRGARSRKRLDWAHRQLRRRPWVLVPARFVPGGRTASAFAAGLLKMRWRTFLRWDATAVILWATVYVALGYVGGRTFQGSLWPPLLIALGMAGLVGILGELARRLLDRHEEG
jgi:membrane protein DedA with SNARE-associated domain